MPETAAPLSELVERLDAAEIRARLDAIEAERRALMPLLRAARARDRARRSATERAVARA